MARLLTSRTAADPLDCEEFGYGLGTPTGILLLRYRIGDTAALGATRDDFLHQLYWCRDGHLQVNGPDGEVFVIGPDQAFWARRAVSHDVFTVGGTLAYRAFIREIPRGLVDVRHGVVSISEEAAQQLVRLAAPGLVGDTWTTARSRLMSGLHEQSMAGEDSGSAASLVAAALREDPSSDRSLADFAREHHVSAKTLQRDFARTFGCSFSRWRTQARLAAAREMVGASTVTEIAHRVGYSSPSAFVAAFNREYGCTPGRLSSLA